MAPFTRRFSLSFFSMYAPRRFRIVSRMPPISPARTSCTKRSSNALGWSASASAKVEPASTFDFTARSTLRKTGLSAWVPMISSAWTSGRPASIMTENWRVKTRMSFVVTLPPIPGSLSSKLPRLRRTREGSMPICDRRLRTACSSPASISPWRSSPWRFLPAHFQTGIFTVGAALLEMFAAAWAMELLASSAAASLLQGFAPVESGRGARVDYLAAVCGRGVPCPFMSMLRSSSGSEERPRASSTVMSFFPTSTVRLWLKVCIPNFCWPICICE